MPVHLSPKDLLGRRGAVRSIGLELLVIFIIQIKFQDTEKSFSLVTRFTAVELYYFEPAHHD